MVVATTMMEEDMVGQMVEMGMVAAMEEVAMEVAMEEVAMVLVGMALVVVEVGGWVTCANSIDRVPAAMAPNAASCISEDERTCSRRRRGTYIKSVKSTVKSVQSVN